MRIFRIVFVFMVLCSMFYSCQECCAADAEVATEYWRPFRIKSASGMIFGLDVDLMHIIGKRMDVSFNFQWYPWPRCLHKMKEGRTDFMTGLARTPDREGYIEYCSVPYFVCAPRFYARKGLGDKIKSYDDLYNYSIAYCRDSKYFEPFDSDSKLNKEDKDNERTMLRMLLNGRVDLIVGTDCQVQYDIHEMRLEDKIEEVDYKPQSRVRLYIGVSKGSPYAARMEELNAVLRSLMKEGALQKLKSRYFPPPKSP